MASILHVNDLRISFRTSNGKVQAVRGINFDLEKGKTLAIVGESGSGKSVTSKAILGIQAGNSITEAGEIIYDGRDLLKISEEEFHKIRGDKIAMIFQDPLSSLNPIVKVGKQITEAMLLKNKASRKDARREFDSIMKLQQENMIAANKSNEARVKALCAELDKFCVEANRRESNYNNAESTAEDLLGRVEQFLFLASKNQKQDVKAVLREFVGRVNNIKAPFFRSTYETQLNDVTNRIKEIANTYRQDKNSNAVSAPALEAAKELSKVLGKMLAQERPDFFSVGYYSLKHPEEKLEKWDIQKLNKEAKAYFEQNFMGEFGALQQQGVTYSHQQSLEAKRNLMVKLQEAKAYFGGDLERKAALRYAAELASQVEASIDRLEVHKDNVAYTFGSSIIAAVEKYFAGVKHNPKEEIRFAKQTAKHDRLVKRGRKVEWRVIPKSLHNLEQLKDEIVSIVTRMEERCQLALDPAAEFDAKARCAEILEFMKDKASKVVYKITPSMAKEKALKLMEEVGINEPRRRYYQYPFEFSGGMRQRVVIAIALSADPEILICDEPTTALDVTIQAQILELINNLKRHRNLSVIFITHDLGVVANMADDIAVMYAGKIIEYGTAEEVFYDPRHPYTWALLSSMPDLDTKEKLEAIPGTPPNMIYPPVGDAFADRNKYAMKIDFERQPPLFEITPT
ncbi:MAG: ABC transporter ATP-binding protein, partial [Oscillospiraceae bacterium]|nr:ABC transporter ATP-binding protein [Oscillospiraceae bacterium]